MKSSLPQTFNPQNFLYYNNLWRKYCPTKNTRYTVVKKLLYCCICAVILHITLSCGQQNDDSSTKMTDLITLLASYVNTRCSCDFTTAHISNSRWVCNPNTPNVVIFRAAVAGTTMVNRDEIATYIMQWADMQNTINVGAVNLQLQGTTQCQDQDCMVTGAPPTGTTSTTGTTASPVTQPFWVFGIIGGIILILILVIVIVLVVLCRRNSQQQKPP